MENPPSTDGPFEARQRPADYLAELTLLPNFSFCLQTKRSLGLSYNWYSIEHGQHQYFEFIDCTEAHPGDIVVARMWLIAPDVQIGKLKTGQEFEIILSGTTKIGTGRVLEVFDKRLKAN